MHFEEIEWRHRGQKEPLSELRGIIIESKSSHSNLSKWLDNHDHHDTLEWKIGHENYLAFVLVPICNGEELRQAKHIFFKSPFYWILNEPSFLNVLLLRPVLFSIIIVY